MTPEEFLEAIGRASHYRDKGKARRNRAMWNYFHYLQTYHAKKLVTVFEQASYRTNWSASHRACEDRDAGRPPLEVPELDALEDIQRLKKSLGLLPADQPEGEQK